MLGDTIRSCRTSSGLTQEELAAAVGVSTIAIQHYEENKWKPGMNTISRIADALQVSVVDLFEGYKAIYDDSGDIIIVEKDCWCQIKVVARVANTKDLSN